MQVLLRLTAFEVRHQARRISTWVYFGLFFGLAFVVMCMMAGVWPDADMGSRVLLANSPAALAGLLSGLSVLAVPVTAALAGRAGQRDFEMRSHPLFFTTPTSKTAYLGGRYLGSVIMNLVVLLGLPLGAAAVTIMPFADQGRIGSPGFTAYAVPFLVVIVPNVLVTSAVFLVLAALTRKFVAVQAGGLVLLLGWLLSRVFATAIDARLFTHLSDPFGVAPLNYARRYWTVAEQNTLPIPLSTELLANRALWLAVGALILVYGIVRFRFAQFAREGGEQPSTAGAEAPSLARRLRLPVPTRVFGAPALLRQFLTLARSGFLRIVRGVWFWILAVLCVVFVLLTATEMGSIYGTQTYPVTYQVLELLTDSFPLFLVIIIAVYAGELVWEEREAGAAQITDSLPVPSWVPLAAKTAALVAMSAVLLAMGMLTGMLIQSARGYFRFEPGLYARELFGIQLPSYVLLVVLAVAVHVLANHKYVGHLVVILYFVLSPFVYTLVLSHNLAMYGTTPETMYSDMNGYGHTVGPWAWYTLFWAATALILAVLSNLFWVRGQETGSEWRMRLARARASRPVLSAAAVALVLILGTGGFILHNTVRLNEWKPDEEHARIQAEYEKRYKQYERLPQPKVTGVSLEVDIYPEQRDLRMRGVYRLVNRSGRPVDQIHVDLYNTLTVDRLELGVPARRFISDTEKGYHAFRLARPLAPGDSTELRFTLSYITRGFENEPSFLPVVENGTFFENSWLPGIGYNAGGELTDEGAREKHGLKERPRVTPITDPAGRLRNELSRDADWVRFSATVSTSADQTAIAPGRLTREWKRGGRRFFRYEMNVPMLNFYSFLSARFKVRRDRWNGVDIEVFHHPGHEYNVDRMIRAVKKSLDYYTREFGPYQHSQVRIVEFPRYGEYAQSFAGTIPYSEGIGFIADVEADDIDYPFFVTAHEVGHQWWGHQAVPADVQGSAMLSETLAEYSALMVMEKEYGREQIGPFLRFELDAYLKGRGTERRAEMPVALVERQQYIHYNKGALAMYALRDYIGEAAVNGALRAYLREERMQGPPYPTSRDLMRHLEAATPDSLGYLLNDLFQTVTLWDLRATRAEGRELPDGRYQVEVTVTASKHRSDGLGDSEEVPMADWVEVGVYGEDEDEPIFLRKVRVTSGTRRYRMIVSERPLRAGIDPLHKLIDRDLDDNVAAVTRAPGSSAPARTQARRDTARRDSGATDSAGRR